MDWPAYREAIMADEEITATLESLQALGLEQMRKVGLEKWAEVISVLIKERNAAVAASEAHHVVLLAHLRTLIAKWRHDWFNNFYAATCANELEELITKIEQK
jgi:hypothetical protein